MYSRTSIFLANSSDDVLIRLHDSCPVCASLTAVMVFEAKTTTGIESGIDWTVSSCFKRTSAAGYKFMNDSQMSSPGPDYHCSRQGDLDLLYGATRRTCTEVDPLSGRPPLRPSAPRCRQTGMNISTGH